MGSSSFYIVTMKGAIRIGRNHPLFNMPESRLIGIAYLQIILSHPQLFKKFAFPAIVMIG